MSVNDNFDEVDFADLAELELEVIGSVMEESQLKLHKFFRTVSEPEVFFRETLNEDDTVEVLGPFVSPVELLGGIGPL